MKKFFLLLIGLGFTAFGYASSGEAYLQKFQTYYELSESLSTNPSPEFFSFIKDDSPLANKLRAKWLYKLAKEKNWSLFNDHYKSTNDLELQCYYWTARYHLGYTDEAITAAKPIWLSGQSQPSACNGLFDQLLAQDKNREQLIVQRITLALQKRNLSLARYLLKQLNPPRLHDVALLNKIYQKPTAIATLEVGQLHDDYYLYGLKRMVSTNMDQAIKYWKHVNTKKLLSEAQQQEFLAHVALYKAMRNHKDAPFWFAQVKREYYTDLLLDWQIRFALKTHHWKKVERLIRLANEPDNLAWQYWLARSLEAQGKKQEAHELYEQLAKTRNYYGFLASTRIKKPFAFEHEPTNKNLAILAPYLPFTDQIKQLYNTNQPFQASRMINDFVLELSKEERSALAYWLAQELEWYDKALYLSNNDELNNHLTLRFPLAYRKTITKYANNYHLSKEFIFAIIRQESTFRENVVSSAGAHGLMQVLPKTAKNIANQQKIPYQGEKQLFLAPINIQIGSAYLQYLGKRFNQHPLLMAAAYNAGPSQVIYWLKNHPPKQIDIWIETLPWHETRNYLKNVMAFFAVYQYRMKEKPDLSEFMKPF
ncbi:transglycosylase SLT domain-containing protein [Legionella yabuuchiae]|uniref:transglycosylase SLT domain-containing protein n=1 Tax=Legionella yabuuchiae TaxID=376727 RepID=UPI001054DD63|nr:transglycosylase SLT domain-containing protein [Legionella yabuuchiae]